MPDRLYRPTEIARTFDVSPSTVRRWSELFAEHLSSFASPTEPGQHRKYTEDDFSVLAFVASRTEIGMSLEEIAELLKVATPEDLAPEARAEEPEAPPEAPEWPESEEFTEEVPEAAQMALVPLMRALELVNTQSRLIADQAERISRQETELADHRLAMRKQGQDLEQAERRLAEVEERLKAIEETKTQAQERRPGFFDRLFGRGE